MKGGRRRPREAPRPPRWGPCLSRGAPVSRLRAACGTQAQVDGRRGTSLGLPLEHAVPGGHRLEVAAERCCGARGELLEFGSRLREVLARRRAPPGRGADAGDPSSHRRGRLAALLGAASLALVCARPPPTALEVLEEVLQLPP